MLRHVVRSSRQPRYSVPWSANGLPHRIIHSSTPVCCLGAGHSLCLFRRLPAKRISRIRPAINQQTAKMLTLRFCFKMRNVSSSYPVWLSYFIKCMTIVRFNFFKYSMNYECIKILFFNNCFNTNSYRTKIIQDPDKYYLTACYCFRPFCTRMFKR